MAIPKYLRKDNLEEEEKKEEKRLVQIKV